MKTPGPLRVTVVDGAVDPGPSPAPRHSARAAARAWRHALSLDPTFAVQDEPGGTRIHFVEPEDLANVPSGDVAVVDWPRDRFPPPINEGLRGIVTHSPSGAHHLSAALHHKVPVTAIPVPRAPNGPRGSTPSLVSFTGSLHDSWHSSQSTIGEHRLRIDSRCRMMTIIADARDSDRLWMDAVFAFTESFRQRSDLVLIVWMTHRDPTVGPAIIRDISYRSTPYACRVITGVGAMEGPQYRELIHRTDVMVAGNDSDGGIRSLLDFMSLAVPIIGSPSTYPGLLNSDNCLPADTHEDAVGSWLAAESRLTRTRSLYNWPALAAAMVHWDEMYPARSKRIAEAGQAAARHYTDPVRAANDLAAFIVRGG